MFTIEVQKEHWVYIRYNEKDIGCLFFQDVSIVKEFCEIFEKNNYEPKLPLQFDNGIIVDANNICLSNEETQPVVVMYGGAAHCSPLGLIRLKENLETKGVSDGRSLCVYELR